MPGLAESHIRAWLEEFVVGLNLCPFARPPPGADNLRIAVCEETAITIDVQTLANCWLDPVQR